MNAQTKQLVKRLEDTINATPTGELRNLLTNVNIALRTAPVAEDIDWKEKAKELARLLLEARDMLPHITMTTAKLHRLDLTLADRIEDSLEPWKVEG